MMPTRDDRALRELRDGLERLAPTPEAVARIANHALRRSVSEGSRRHRVSPLVARAVGATIAVAALTVLVAVALFGATDQPRDPNATVIAPFDGPDTPVARELVRAGDVAADAPWGPLLPGEYYHLYATNVPGHDPQFPNPTGFEVWLDERANGQVLLVTGSVDPDRLPTISPGGGLGYSTLPAERAVTLEESLTKANSVSQFAWRADGTGLQRSWARRRDGFVVTYDSAKPGPEGRDSVAAMSPEQIMRMYWGATIDEIDALPTKGGAAMDAAIERLLDDNLDTSPMRSNRIPTGSFGVTVDQLAREERIQFAVTLLGGAPLPPEARRSLYRWLAKQPGAQLERNVRDANGRAGVRVTFEHVYDERLPARQVTVGELLDAAIEGGAEIEPDAPVKMLDLPRTQAEMLRRRNEDLEQPIAREHEFEVPAHTERRTWRVTIIIDPSSGELLQQQFHMEKRASAEVPELALHPHGLQVIRSVGRGSTEQMSGSQLYLSRGRATLEQAESPVCSVQQEICRP